VDTAASRQLNAEASRQSLVLLKNAGKTLPFAAPRSGEVVVIGPSANSTRLLGGGHYARNLPVVDGFETGGIPGIPGAIEALLKGTAGSKATVRYVPGIKCTPRTDSVCTDPQFDAGLLADAVAAAKGAAQVVVVVNLQSREPCDTDKAFDANGEFNSCGYESEQHDRPSIAVPKQQEALALAVLAAAKGAGVPAAVVLVHGGALAINTLRDVAPAILDAHYPSETVGSYAVADALYGRFSPAGKLTYTVMDETFVNISNFASMDMTAPPGRTYRCAAEPTVSRPGRLPPLGVVHASARADPVPPRGGVGVGVGGGGGGLQCLLCALVLTQDAEAHWRTDRPPLGHALARHAALRLAVLAFKVLPVGRGQVPARPVRLRLWPVPRKRATAA